MTTRRFITLCIMFIGIVYISFVPATSDAAAKTPSDIPAKYEKEVMYLLNKGIVEGYEDQTFRPKKDVTRAETAVMVGRSLGLSGNSNASSFDDVREASFATGYIESAYEAGIIKGVGQNQFEPDRPITRGEMAVLLVRAFDLVPNASSNFKDVPANHPYSEKIQAVTAARIVQGDPDGLFRPEDNIRREEFSLMVARALEPAFKPCQDKCITETQYVTANGLRIRQGPSTSSDILGGLSKNTAVKVEFNQASRWAKLLSGGVTGYIHRDYLTSKKPEPPRKNKIVAIDAGHGGKDPGARGNGLVEKEVNLAVAKLVQRKLEDSGIDVVMIRSDDTFVELEDRAPIAVAKGADIFVSIHSNYFSDPRANGTETYYYRDHRFELGNKSKRLASLIQQDLYRTLDTTNRGVKTAPFWVIKHNPLPSALVELAFLSNPSDADKLKYKRQEAAGAIARGIKQYYN